jgi:hypothetical protein
MITGIEHLGQYFVEKGVSLMLIEISWLAATCESDIPWVETSFVSGVEPHLGQRVAPAGRFAPQCAHSGILTTPLFMISVLEKIMIECSDKN